MRFLDEPVRDLEESFAAEMARLAVVHMVADDGEVAYCVVEEGETVLCFLPTELEAHVWRSRELIARLDDMRLRVVRPLFAVG